MTEPGGRRRKREERERKEREPLESSVIETEDFETTSGHHHLLKYGLSCLWLTFGRSWPTKGFAWIEGPAALGRGWKGKFAWAGMGPATACAICGGFWCREEPGWGEKGLRRPKASRVSLFFVKHCIFLLINASKLGGRGASTCIALGEPTPPSTPTRKGTGRSMRLIAF